MFQLIFSSYFISVNKLLENYANEPVGFPPGVQIGHQPPKSAILGLKIDKSFECQWGDSRYTRLTGRRDDRFRQMKQVARKLVSATLERPPDALTADLMKQQPLVTVGRLFSKVAGNAIIASTRSVIFHRQKATLHTNWRWNDSEWPTSFPSSTGHFFCTSIHLVINSFGWNISVIWVTKEFEPLGFVL